ncbi:MAG: hypothetical protein HOV79_05290 [Hamadaea sp.]|nr:hypothetical protein [Hamadaea sp.]
MALLYRADLRPSKLELLTAWLPGRPWFHGEPGAEVTRVAACRFDDPAGEVGVETMLVRAGEGPVLHVPLTYRGAPLDGGAQWLVGTCEHSVLGTRWVYDACGDPVYAAVLAAVIATGGTEAEEWIEGARREPAMTLLGSGSTDAPQITAVRRVDDGDPTVVETDGGVLRVVRVVGAASVDGDVLTGTVPGSAPVVLAALQV